MTFFLNYSENNQAAVAAARNINGDITLETPTSFQITDGTYMHRFVGTGFEFKLGKLVGGTVSEYHLASVTGALLQDFTNISGLSAETLQGFIASHDMTRFVEVVLAGDDTINGSPNADHHVIGYGGSDVLLAQGDGNLIEAGAGDDTLSAGYLVNHLDGGDGLDQALFSTTHSAFTITHEGEWLHLSAQNGNGTRYGQPVDDFIKNIERAVFTDGTLALDISGHAGQAYRIYQAAFDRTPDKDGLKFWLGKIDAGMSLHDVSQNFLASSEFASIYGASSSNLDFVNRLYGNILERNGEATGLSFWTDQLDHGTWSRPDVLAYFSESPENTAKVAPLIADGIWLG